MDHAEYVYTIGLTEADIEAALQEGEHGVLALAAHNDAYATPISYHYDGDRLLLRVSDHDQDAEKIRYLETTDTATFVCYEATRDDSWSIHIRGSIEIWDEDVDEATLNEWFPPFRLFDEAVETVDFTLYELELETVIGRRTTTDRL